MKRISIYIGLCMMLICTCLPAFAGPEAEFRKLEKHYTLRADGSQELRVRKELTLYTHAAMNGLYGETFITYDPAFQELQIHQSYTQQKDGTIVKTPDNAFVEVLPSVAADAPAYNRLKEMVVVHTGLELGATIYLDYSIISKPGYLPALDVCCPVRELSPIKEFICTIETEKSPLLHYELLNYDAPAKRMDTRNNRQCVQWTLRNVSPRPYNYPTQHDRLSLIQEAASGMQPVIVATTHTSYAEALKTLRAQFVPGDEAVIKEKVTELAVGAEGDKQKLRDAIGQYMMYRYSRLGNISLKLADTGYRLRPASEVLRSGYGTTAELVNLDVCLQRAAGLEADIVICALRASKTDNVGLSGIVSVFARSGDMAMRVPLSGTAEADLQEYMTITDLNGNSVELENKWNEHARTYYTFEADDKRIRTLEGGIRLVKAEGKDMALILSDNYAKNTEIDAPVLLPMKYDHTFVTTVKLSEGMTWVRKSDREIVNACGKVVFTYEQAENAIKVTCRLVVNQQLLTPSSYPDFYALMREWKDENNYLLLFTPEAI